MISWRFVDSAGRGVPLLLAALGLLGMGAFLGRRARVGRAVEILGSLILVLAGLLLGCVGSSSARASTAGTPAGNYSITVNAYTVSGSGASPDATVRIPVTIN